MSRILKWAPPFLIAFTACGCKEKAPAASPALQVESRDQKGAPDAVRERPGKRAERPVPKKSQWEIEADFRASLLTADDAKLVGIIKNLLKTGDMSPETNDATRVEDTLSMLLRRRSPELRAIMDSLPPGRNSEAIVKSAFVRGNFSSIPEIFTVIGQVVPPELAASAVSGALFHYGFTPREDDGKTVGVSPEQLSKYRQQGLDDQDFRMLLCRGIAKNEFSFEDAKAYLDLGDQQTVCTISQTLPSETTCGILADAMAQGSAVDVTGLQIFVRSYSGSSPEKALDWAYGLPPENRDTAVTSAFGVWTENDPLAASKYIGGMEKGRSRDLGAWIVVRDCVDHDRPDEAKAWADQIEDQVLKGKALDWIEKHGGLK